MSHIYSNLDNLNLKELRALWHQLWRRKAHKFIKPALLKNSIIYKIEYNKGRVLTPRQKKKLSLLTKRYKNNPQFFDNDHSSHHFGTRLIRVYKNHKCEINVVESGFKYNEKIYPVLSEIYKEIDKRLGENSRTGTKVHQ